MSSEIKSLLIKNIKEIISCDEKDSVYNNSFIYSENGIIRKIGLMTDSDLASIKATEEVDASNCIVYPGLINTHHHLYQAFSRNMPEAQNMELFAWLDYLVGKWKSVNMDGELFYYSALVALGELVKTGCTTCVDQNDGIPNNCSRDVIKREFEAAEKLGIRLCLGRGSIDIGEGMSPILVQTIDQIIADSEDAIDKYHDPSKNSMKMVILAPCAPFCNSKECYIKTAELARRKGVRLNTHLCETKDEEAYTMEKYKMRPLEFMKSCNFIGPDVFFNHGIHFNDEEIKELAKTKTGISHCPISNMKLSSGVMRMKELKNNNITIGLGVDGSASNDGSNLLEEMRMAYLLHRLQCSHEAPNGYEILKMATVGGAKLIGREDIGCLKEGNCCDLFMIKSEKLEMVGCDYDFKSYLCTVGYKGYTYMTIINGKIVFKDNVLTGIEEMDVYKKAKSIVDQYFKTK